MNAHTKLVTALLILLCLTGCHWRHERIYQINVVLDPSAGNQPVAHHVAAPGNKLEWFGRDAANGFVITFDDPNACTGESPLNKPGTFLVCPGFSTSCTLQKFTSEEGYKITLASAAEKSACVPHGIVTPPIRYVLPDHCPGCIISVPPDQGGGTAPPVQ